MVYDLFRLHYSALDVLRRPDLETAKLSVGEWLEREGYGRAIRDDYIIVRYLYPSCSWLTRSLSSVHCGLYRLPESPPSSRSPCSSGHSTTSACYSSSTKTRT